MDKIVCLDKDYKIHKVYDTLDLLLEDIKGSKTQAQKALDDNTLSFRGYKLIEQGKLSQVYADLYTEKVDSLQEEFGSTIVDLETRLKEATKTERKAKFRVDELEDDYSTKYKELKDSNEKEQEILKQLNVSEKETLDSEYKLYISELKNKQVEQLNDLKSQSKTSSEEIITIYSEHTDLLNAAINKYTSESEKQKVAHQKAVNDLNKVYTDKIDSMIQNINSLNDYLENNRKVLLNRVNSLMEVMTKMVEGDKKVYLLDSDNLPKLKESVQSNNVKAADTFKFEKFLQSINLDDFAPNKLAVIEPIKTDKLPKEPKVIVEKPLDEIELPKIPVSKVDTAKPIEKVIPKVTEESTVEVKETVDEIVTVKGVELKNKADYKNLTSGAKGFYLSNLMLKGLTVNDLEYFGNVLEDIKGDVTDTIISELVARNKTYSEYADFLKEINLDNALNRLKLTPKEVEAFLELEQKPEPELKDVTPSNPEEYQKEKKEPKDGALPKGAINFNWAKYIEILNENVDMEELLDKDTLTLRDLQTVIDVPSKQILGMLGVLKKLGYQKDFSNERVVSKLETILLIVVASSHASQKGKESLEDLINKLYPSWIHYKKQV